MAKKEVINSLKKDQKITAKGWRKYKGTISWVIFTILLISVAFFRYGSENWISEPEILMSDFKNGPYEMTPEGAFVLSFSHRMNKDSVRRAITIFPSIKYSEKWEGNSVYLTAYKRLKKGDKYDIYISKLAKNFFGKELKRKYELHYIVGDDPKIIGIYPEEEKIKGYEHIAVLFSSPMISEKEILEKKKQDMIVLLPNINGEWIWHDSKTLVFHQKETFPKSTEIRLISKGILRTRDGGNIDDDINTVFHTERLFLENNMDEDKKLLQVSEPFVLTFSTKIRKNELKENLILTEESGKKVLFKIIEFPGEMRYGISSTGSKWLYNETYTVSISSELMPKYGNLSLGEDKEMSFQTNGILDIENDFYKNNSIFLNKENDSFSFLLKEELSEERIKKSIQTIPEEKIMVKKDGSRYTVTMKNFSQKRENIDLYLTTKINSKEGRYISKPILFNVKKSPKLLVRVQQNKKNICILSNNKLKKSTLILKSNSGEETLRKSMKIDSEKKCTGEKSFPYSYSLEKSFLKPGKKINASIEAKDIFGEKLDTRIRFNRKEISRNDILLQRKDYIFYQYVSEKTDLRFQYQTKNLKNVIIITCKLPAKKAIEIETQYERKWFSFNPSPEKCIRYKSVRKDINTRWGKVQNNVFDIAEAMDADEIDTGMYYVKILALGYTNEKGEPIEANGMMQFSHWQMFSKRGESALVWLIDRKKNIGIPGASLKFISNDGMLLQTKKTDKEGIFFQENNKLKYDFLLAKKGNEELLLDVFSSEGFEPARFDIPFNPDGNKYLYQFYLEDPNVGNVETKGVFIFREKNEGNLIVPNISEAVISVYDQYENIIWKSYRPFDEYGTLRFGIKSNVLLKNGSYQLSVCAGSQQEVCHGLHFWTFFSKGLGKIEETNKEYKREKKKNLKNLNKEMIGINNIEKLSVGDTLNIPLKNLVKNKSMILTVERDEIFFYKKIVPRKSDRNFNIQITEDMLPEFIVTVTQSTDNGLIADMRRFIVSKKAKELRLLHSEYPDMTFSNRAGKKEKEVSVISFLLQNPKQFGGDELLEAFYPNLGTSIVTAASVSISKRERLSTVSVLPAHIYIRDIVVVSGSLEKDSTETIKENSSDLRYILAQDKNGHFMNKVLNNESVKNELEIVSDFPGFLRVGDKSILRMSILNRSKKKQNIKIQMDIPDGKLINGKNIFLGIPSMGSRDIDIPLIVLKTKNNEIPVSIQVMNDEKTLIRLKEKIRIGNYEQPFSKRLNSVYHSFSSDGRLKMPITGGGEWEMITLISPSPLVYAISTLEAFLSQKAMNEREIMSHIGIYFLYKGILDSKDAENISFSAKNVENELSYLKGLQNSDGGWGINNKSNSFESAQMAKSLSSALHGGAKVPEDMRKDLKKYLKDELDKKVNKRIREGISRSDLSDLEIIEEIYILQGLSSLTSSGMSYANSWYQEREIIPNEALALLLLVFEDYRDQGVSGMKSKIEKITQILKKNMNNIDNKKWLSSSQRQSGFMTDFVVTSWFLEGLVRQEGAHVEIPKVMKWLIEQKEKRENQVFSIRESFLTAMGGYLQVFSAEVNASTIELKFLNSTQMFTFTPEKEYQVFRISGTRIIEEGERIPEVFYKTDLKQSLFIEAIAKQKNKIPIAVNRGVSIYQSINKHKVRRGDMIEGEIIIFSNNKQKNLMIMHPQIAGARLIQKDTDILSNTEEEISFTIGYDRQWYLIRNLEIGETKIPFKWEAEYSGIYKTKPIYAYLRENMNIYGISNTETIEIR